MKRNYIAGEWQLGSHGQANINPSDTSDIIDHFAAATAADVDLAVGAALEAQKLWTKLSAETRADVLDEIGTALLDRAGELGELLSREEGKIRAEGTAEVQRAGHIFKFYAGETLRIGGDRPPSIRPNVDIEVMREPIGVVGIITPWNFPIAIPAWKIAPALAYGNAVVFKPADLVPSVVHALAEIIDRSSAPKGLFNLLCGRGSIVGEEILNASAIKGISFTGSVNTGRHIASRVSARLAKYQCELGGKNPTVVLDDADLKTAIQVVTNSAFFSTGQRCTATSRVIVTPGIYERFIEGFAVACKSLKVGHALDPLTKIGPVVDQRQLDQNLSYIEVGKTEGAKLLVGGERLKLEKDGYYFSPAIFVDVDPGMRIAQEEIFGPVASVIRARDYDDALEIANGTEFGLSSAICTSSLKYATDFKKRSEAGLVMVNLPTAGVDYTAALSGQKNSSVGSPEQGRYASEFYTRTKTTYTSPT